MADMTIDIDAVFDALKERRRVNSINLMHASFMRDDKVLYVDQATRRAFKYTGLNNTSFIDTHFCLKEEPSNG